MNLESCHRRNLDGVSGSDFDCLLLTPEPPPARDILRVTNHPPDESQ
jgi:hypothetical protein